MSSSLENATSTRVIGYARPVLLIIALLALTGIGLGAFRRPLKTGGRSLHPRSTNRMMRHSRSPSLPAGVFGACKACISTSGA